MCDTEAEGVISCPDAPSIYDIPRVLRTGLTAIALSLAVGALVNDSGVALPATAAALLVPLLVWLVASAPASVAESAQEVGGPRVNVGVRGSTGRTS
jgi:hypothetical protein